MRPIIPADIVVAVNAHQPFDRATDPKHLSQLSCSRITGCTQHAIMMMMQRQTVCSSSRITAAGGRGSSMLAARYVVQTRWCFAAVLHAHLSNLCVNVLRPRPSRPPSTCLTNRLGHKLAMPIALAGLCGPSSGWQQSARAPAPAPARAASPLPLLRGRRCCSARSSSSSSGERRRSACAAAAKTQVSFVWLLLRLCC